MDIIHVYVKFYDHFSFTYSHRIKTVSAETFEKMKKGIGNQFSHFDNKNHIRQDMEVIEVRQATLQDYITTKN